MKLETYLFSDSEDELSRIPSSVWWLPAPGRGLPHSTRSISSPSRRLPPWTKWIPRTRRLSSSSRGLPPTGRWIPTPGWRLPSCSRRLPPSSRGLPSPGWRLPSRSWRLPTSIRRIPAAACSRGLSLHAPSRWGLDLKNLTVSTQYSDVRINILPRTHSVLTGVMSIFPLQVAAGAPHPLATVQ